jgi:outer membrane lipoprotein-sorting protein
MPRKRIDRRLALSAGFACLVLLAGCTAVPSGSVSDADSVGEHVQARYDSIDRYEATVTKTVRGPSQSSSVRATLTVDTDDAAQIEYHTGPRAGTTTTVDTSGPSAAPSLSAGVRTATDGRVPSYGALASELVRTSNVTVERTTVLDGHRTAVVSFAPERTENDSASAADVERRVWVDTDRRIPLRIETTWMTDDGKTVTETVRYANVTLTEHGSQTTADETAARGARA